LAGQVEALAAKRSVFEAIAPMQPAAFAAG
jgi:hypothetical protein